MCQNPSLHNKTNIDAALARVVEIMHQLRAPGGCPWDRRQTFDSIRTHTLEEAYEVLEAIGDRNWPGLREELGDLLLQVVFYAEMAEEAGYFAIDDVLRELADKLIRRHPHVFAEPGSAATPDEALGRWNAAKAAERTPAGAASQAPPPSLMAGIPKHLPALAEAGKLGGRAARAGFDWPAAALIWSKIEEELTELRAALTRPDGGGRTAEIEDELGDVLFSVVNLARHLDLDPEAALKRANRKFLRRFQHMEDAARAQGRELNQLAAAEWDERWRESKMDHP